MGQDFKDPWVEVNSVDDLLTPFDIKLAQDLKQEINEGKRPRCPHLKTEGEHFFYCGARSPEIPDEPLGPWHPLVVNRTDVVSLQLHCTDDYRVCLYYKTE